MDPRFNDIFTRPENAIFRVVFYPDRIYHAQYLNATRSPRYRYNVREVRNVVRSAYILAGDASDPDHLPPEVTGGQLPGGTGDQVRVSAGTTLADAEQRLIMATLEQCDGNRARTAEKLGISVKTLYNRLKAYEDEG